MPASSGFQPAATLRRAQTFRKLRIDCLEQRSLLNAAPVLDNSGFTTLPEIDEDVTSPTGTFLTTMLATGANGAPITDPDVGALQGIAVANVDNTNGLWQYSINFGGTWTSFGSPTITSARLLATSSSSRIRFVPAPNFHGTVTAGLTFYAWDRTSGTHSSFANISTRGGTTAFSIDSETVAIVVREVNDAPQLTAGDLHNLEFVKNSSPTPIGLSGLGYSGGKSPDEDSQSLSVQILSVPRPQLGTMVRAGNLAAIVAGETLSLAELRGLRFLPATDAVGVDSFSFQITDDGASAGVADPRSTIESITVTVNHKAALSEVIDINQTPYRSNPGRAVFIDDIAIFTATTNDVGVGLWRSDGTAAGTYPLLPFGSLTTGAEPDQLTTVGNVVYFTASDGMTGRELWVTDGTVAGTRLVVDLYPGKGGSFPEGLHNFNNTLYFYGASSLDYTLDIFTTDGTAAGTVPITQSTYQARLDSTQPMAHVGDTLFYKVFRSSTVELWKTDGTMAGKTLVKSFVSNGSYDLVASGNQVFFSLNIVGYGTELWASDGTNSNTRLVKDLYAGESSSGPTELVDVGGTVYFKARVPWLGHELYKSDGTEAGTVLVKDVYPGWTSGVSGPLTVIGDTVYFQGQDPTYGVELWRSDGSEAGTTVVTDINFGTLGSFPEHLTIDGDLLYFRAITPTGENKLWRSDGTVDGTFQLSSLPRGPASNSIQRLAANDGRLFFRGIDGELWISDGTISGTYLVKDLQTGTANSAPSSLQAFGESIVFSADNGVLGRELWISDGTVAGTQLLKDLASGANSGLSATAAIAVSNSTAYFEAANLSGVYELWKSDGTSTGTSVVKNINAGSSIYWMKESGEMNGIVYFSALTSANGRELWRTDGTPGGTYLVKEINPSYFSSDPKKLTKVGNQLFFAAKTTESSADELWVTDGTANGTMIVKDTSSGSVGSSVNNLIDVGGVLLFTANSSGLGTELWRSDGTNAGTFVVKDILPGSPSSDPTNFLVVDGILYFQAATAVGYELWRSDGTSAGTSLLKDIGTSGTSSYPANLTNAGGTIFFTAGSTTTGHELWRTDGTAAGTILVKDITPGQASSTFGSFGALGNRVFFTVTRSDLGAELWTSDGTSNGTMPVKDYFPGPASSNPGSFRVVGDKFFFTANDNVHGTELYSYRDSRPTVTTIPNIETATNAPNSFIDLFNAFEDDITPDAGLKYSVVGNTNSALFAGLTIDPVAGLLALDYAPDVAGSSLLTIQATDAMGWSVSQSVTVTVAQQPAFSVVATTLTSSGFMVEFDEPLNPVTLNLFDQGGLLGPADATLIGANVGPVYGSIVLDPSQTKLVFVSTSGVLAPDTYSLMLRTGEDAFRAQSGDLLDGDPNQPGLNNLQALFVVPSTSGTITAGVPNFTRSSGQTAHLPADSIHGIPITLSRGAGVRSANFTLNYDPLLLNITDVLLAADVTGQLSFDRPAPGKVTFTITSPIQLSTSDSPITVVHLLASVPSIAPYGAGAVLDIADLIITDSSGNAVPAMDDDGVQLVAYLGDANGSQSYNAPDATLTQRLIVGTNSGLVAYPVFDPSLIVDVTGNGSIQSDDVSQIQRSIVGIGSPHMAPLSSTMATDAESEAEIVPPIDQAAADDATNSEPVMLLVAASDIEGESSPNSAVFYDVTMLRTNTSIASQLRFGIAAVAGISLREFNHVSAILTNPCEVEKNSDERLTGIQPEANEPVFDPSTHASFDETVSRHNDDHSPVEFEDVIDGLMRILQRERRVATLERRLVDEALSRGNWW